MQPEHIVAEDGSWERWILDGKLHREDGPAYIRYEDNATTIKEWWIENCLHREDGPAYVVCKNQKIIYEEWWLDGAVLSKEDFTSIEMIDRMGAYSLFSPIEIARMKFDKQS